MLLWILIALLTAAAILAVLAPLSRAPASASSAAHAARVYCDQLEELERDKAEGRISAGEAEAARTEIARRLIAVDAEAQGEAGAPSGAAARPTARRAVALVALLGIPALSLALYLGLGAPELPGAPIAARLAGPLSPDDVEILVAKVEARLAEEPEEGRGWEVIAPVYLRLGRASDAVQAYRNALRILGATAARQSGLGEALVASAAGIVTAEARAAFEAAETLDPTAPSPRFFLALAAEQEGKPDAAATMLRALLTDTPPDAPWRAAIEESLARVTGGDALTGPSSDDVAAAQSLPPDEQAAMVDSMVNRLAARLVDEPDDVEGWLRLIRSYVVLGRPEAAAEAARAALAGVKDEAARGRVSALIADLGVTPDGAATP